jgi:hypothetical protein
VRLRFPPVPLSIPTLIFRFVRKPPRRRDPFLSSLPLQGISCQQQLSCCLIDKRAAPNLAGQPNRRPQRLSRCSSRLRLLYDMPSGCERAFKSPKVSQTEGQYCRRYPLQLFLLVDFRLRPHLRRYPSSCLGLLLALQTFYASLDSADISPAAVSDFNHASATSNRLTWRYALSCPPLVALLRPRRMGATAVAATKGLSETEERYRAFNSLVACFRLLLGVTLPKPCRTFL